MVNDRIHGCCNVTHVRRVVIAERRGHTNQNRVDFPNLRKNGRCAKALALGTLDLLGIDTMDVRLACIEPVHLGCIDIKASDAKSLLAEEQNQRQPHVAKADDPHPQLPLLNQRQPLCQILLVDQHVSRPQRLKPNSLQNVYVRPKGRTLQENWFFGTYLEATGSFSVSRYHFTVRCKPSSTPIKGRYPKASAAAEMSACECRMSPVRGGP